LFFIYNLLVHKDGFGSQSFTRLFEDSNTSTDKFLYNKQFYDYLAKLDSREIDYHKLFKEELFPEETESDQKNDYLIDLRVRLANFDRSDYKFNVSSDGIGSEYKIYIHTKDGITRELPF
jgi:hypothetical protein